MAKTKLQFYFLAAGLAFLAIFSGLVYRLVSNDGVQYKGYITAAFWLTITGLPVISTFLLAIICIHIFCIRSSRYFTVGGLLLTYIFNQVMRFSSLFLKWKFVQMVHNPRKIQEALFMERMHNNADTTYGRRYKFRDIKSLQDFKDKHPLTDYDHYDKYVERMANGEPNVLISDDLQRFGITSGTTGKGKLIPLPKSRISVVISNQAIAFSAASKQFGWSSPLQKMTMLYVNPRPYKAPSGHLVGPMHLITDDMKLVTIMYTTPWEVLSVYADFEATYLGVLFSVRDPDIAMFMGPFSFTIFKAMTLMEANWKKLVNDIETGTIDKDLVISETVRKACENNLSPDPKRAAELRGEFEKGFEGIMGRIWPNMHWIFGVNTADFTEKLENGYGKGTPVFSPIYASTEGDYGINLWPGETSRYVLLPNSVIFEFIPEAKMSDKDPATLFIDEVKKGENYEMVVSTLSGFYRYRFGDVIRVVDFYHKTPVVEFMYRSGQLLNLRAEKVTEISVDEAVHHVVSELPGAKLHHWTSAESTLLAKLAHKDEFEKDTQFYLIFVELEGNTEHRILDDNYQQQLDDALKERNNYYRCYRNAGTISPPRVFLVKEGTFKALQEFIVANTSASYNQFKVPRKLKTKETLKLMLEQRLS